MQKSSGKTRFRIGIAGGTVGVLLAAVVVAWGRSNQANEAPAAVALAERGVPPTVSVAVAAPEAFADSVEATGTVRAALKADIAAKIMGRVTAVTVREGDRVRAGQLLAQLESADLRAQVAQAEAAVEAARAAVQQARTGERLQATQSSTRVGQAQAALQSAREQLSLVMEGPRRQQKEQAASAVHEAEAALAQARANLSLVREGSRRQQKLQAQQMVIEAESQYRTAKSTYERYKDLYAQDAIPRLRFEEVQTQYEAAGAKLAIAQQQASLVEEGARPQEVQAAEETVRQAEARLAIAKQQRDQAYAGGRTQEVSAARAAVRQAEENLRMARAATAENTMKRDNVSLLAAQLRQAEAALRATRVQAGYARLVAPFDGVVTARLADPGITATPGTPLLRVEDARAFHLDCTVPESRLAGISRGQQARIALDSLGWKGTGRVVEIVPSADARSRTFVVKVALQRLPSLASGLSGRAWFSGGQHNRLMIPDAALVQRGELESVRVVDAQGIARLRLVRAGEHVDGKVEILSGLQAGEQVIVQDAERIPDGAHVQLAASN